MEEFINCICAFIGSFCFGILFNIRGKNLFYAALGGSISWMAFLFSGLFLEIDISQYFFAAATISLYSEVMAMVRKSPVTLFLVTSMIPLVPGGIIFYTMQHIFLGETTLGLQTGIYAFEIAGAIAMGILLMAFVIRLLKQVIRTLSQHKKTE